MSYFYQNEGQRDLISALLSRTSDSQRLVQKFSLGRGDADDLISLGRTIRMIESIAEELQTTSVEGPKSTTGETVEQDIEKSFRVVENLTQRFQLDGPDRLAKSIEDAIDEDGLMKTHMMEDTAASNMMALAEQVVTTEGEKSTVSKTASDSTSETKPIRAPMSIRKMVEDDVWIMKAS